MSSWARFAMALNICFNSITNKGQSAKADNLTSILVVEEPIKTCSL